MKKHFLIFTRKLMAICTMLSIAMSSLTFAGETAKTSNSSTSKKPLLIKVTNLVSPSATVVVGVYTPGNKFLDINDQYKVYYLKPKNGVLNAKLNDLKYGTYGIALFQDLDGNGKINKNALGIPKEPYAFSNNFKPMMKAPNFNNCKFSYNAACNNIEIKLLK